MSDFWIYLKHLLIGLTGATVGLLWGYTVLKSQFKGIRVETREK